METLIWMFFCACLIIAGWVVQSKQRKVFPGGFLVLSGVVVLAAFLIIPFA